MQASGNALGSQLVHMTSQAAMGNARARSSAVVPKPHVHAKVSLLSETDKGPIGYSGARLHVQTILLYTWLPRGVQAMKAVVSGAKETTDAHHACLAEAHRLRGRTTALRRPAAAPPHPQPPWRAQALRGRVRDQRQPHLAPQAVRRAKHAQLHQVSIARGCKPTQGAAVLLNYTRRHTVIPKETTVSCYLVSSTTQRRPPFNSCSNAVRLDLATGTRQSPPTRKQLELYVVHTCAICSVRWRQERQRVRFCRSSRHLCRRCSSHRRPLCQSEPGAHCRPGACKTGAAWWSP